MDVNQALLVQWFDSALKKAKKYQQAVVVGVVGVAVLGTAIFGYTYYKNKVRCAAYKDFMVAMQYYDGTVKTQKSSSDSSIKLFENYNDKWQQTEQAFRQGYEKYRSTELAPAFLAFQAEALINLGKVDQAVQTLQTVIGQVGSEDIKDCYRVKIALIKMDNKDNKIQGDGLSELIAIANNNTSTANEIALYQTGSYFWSKKNYNEAKTYWQKLLVKTMSKTGQPSVFAGQVREKLSLISSESL